MLQIKPVVAFLEDVDVWIYFDQQDNLWRYEIFCVGYTDWGESTTLDFIIEEGLLDPLNFPRLETNGENKPDPKLPLIKLNDHYLLLPDCFKPYHPPISDQAISDCERLLKRQARNRIIHKLRALGYDVLPTLS